MKEKRVLVLFSVILVLFATALVLAANDTEASYACLKKQLGDNCGNTQNTAQNAFNLLAMAYDSKVLSDCKSALNNKKLTNCWGDTASATSCTIKSTALAILALDHINDNVDDPVNWLISKQKLASDLTWYLEIDANNLTACTINGQKFNIADNKKITGSNPTGLTKAYNNYWFEITDIRNNYTVSCDKDFETALIYKKPSSGVYYVSGETHSAAASDTTTEYVNGYCLSTSDKCDYEGTLWASLALSKAGKDISSYIPYLTAMSDDATTQKYFPLSFLFMLDNSVEDYLSKIFDLQKQSKYWDVSGNKLYDTGLALLALQGIADDRVTTTQDYILSLRDTSGDTAGCWKSDTALLLYAGWPKAFSGSGTITSSSDCLTYSHFCISRGQCPVNSTLENFYCQSITDICCNVQPIQQKCSEKGGMICLDKQECSKSVVPAADTDSCCEGSCIDVTPPVNECTDNNYTCKTECNAKTEEQRNAYKDSCNSGQVCCATLPKSSSSSWWLIILLILLIILVALAIVFRNQLKIFWFKIKSNFTKKSSPSQTSRPTSPPPGYPPRPGMMPRQIIPRQGPQGIPPRPGMQRPPMPPVKRPDNKDKEFDDTMKKLKDMSK